MRRISFPLNPIIWNICLPVNKLISSYLFYSLSFFLSLLSFLANIILSASAERKTFKKGFRREERIQYRHMSIENWMTKDFKVCSRHTFFVVSRHPNEMLWTPVLIILLERRNCNTSHFCKILSRIPLVIKCTWRDCWRLPDTTSHACLFIRDSWTWVYKTFCASYTHHFT